MTFIKRVGLSLAAAGIIAGSFSGQVLADTAVTITGNGNGSDNTVLVGNANVSLVGQSSSTEAFTVVDSSASSGGVSANGNVGGVDSATTGNSTSKVVVSVTGGNNTVVTGDCGCAVSPDLSVDIKKNGNKSENFVGSLNLNLSAVGQKTNTKAVSILSSDAKTGKVTANGNVGNVTGVTTGASSSKVKVTVSGGSNTKI